MPGGDRTGPMGFGPMTGRAAGYCAGYDVPGYMNPARGRFGGRGFGGRGGGRGWRNWYYATGLPGWARGRWGGSPWSAPYYPPAPGYGPPPPEDELEVLKSQAEYYKQVLEEVSDRISDLEKKAKKEK